MAERRAACSCGQLTVVVEGEPVRISMRHCLACQRRTGSAFCIQARFPVECVYIDGRATEYVRVSDEGGEGRFFFCPECGATVYYKLPAFPDVVAVPIGAFADPAFPPPRVSVWEARRHPWVAAPEGAEHLD
ncbi:MAG TPA: GFA family protein [Gaiellaceae bacterium]|nr:GFA family protein [Gaiellaceae bacterium]